ncbi:hypothetical protein [Amycolatopsis sp. NPDC004378]
MSDLSWALVLIGGFVVVTVLLHVTGKWLASHDENPEAAGLEVAPPGDRLP